jgi:DNA-binding CsgD family transcriptional regulator
MDGGSIPLPGGDAGAVLTRFARTLAGPPSTPESTVPGVQRHQLYRAVRALLESVGPALVLLDDLQWADDASVELLDYLIRHPPAGPVVFVLACRGGLGQIRLSQSLGQLRPAATQLRLAPLSLSDVDAWMPEESPARRRRLYEASCGNPLFLEILARAGDVRAVLELGRAPSVVDDRVAVVLDDMICSELRGLGRAERRMAAAAAVAGEDFDPALLAHVAQLPEPQAGTAIDALVARQILRQAGTQVVFRHPLVRAAAYRLAGPAWRLAAHGRAAQYLARVHAPAVRQAQHLEYAGGVGDEAASRVLADAAGTVLDTAPSASVRWLHAALRSLPERPDTRDRQDRLLLLLARALGMCGRLGESRDLLVGLRESAAACRDAALELLAANERLLGRLSRARTLLLDELARPGLRGPEEAAIRLELAATEALDGCLAEAELQARAVLRLCTGGERPAVAAAASTLLALVQVLSGSRAAAGSQLAHAQWAVDELDDAALRGMLDLIAPLSWVELTAERYDDARRHLDRGITVARRYGRGHVLPDLYLVRSVLGGRVGQVAEALRDAEDAEEMALQAGGLELHRLAAVMRLRPTLWRTGPAEAKALLDQVRVARPHASPWWRAAAAATIAEVALDLGDVALCREMLGTRGLASGAATALRLLARAELTSGDTAACRELFERAQAAAHAGGLHGELSAVALLEAELLAAEGAVDAAVEAALRAAVEADKGGLPVREGQVRILLGDLCQRQGNLAAARDELGTARRLFHASGAEWLARQAAHALRRMPAGSGRVRPDTSATPTLSAREREVTAMVAEGLTTRAIADRLYLSPRTVEAHLARIFTKLGVTSRAALIRAVNQPAR